MHLYLQYLNQVNVVNPKKRGPSDTPRQEQPLAPVIIMFLVHIISVSSITAIILLEPSAPEFIVNTIGVPYMPV